MVGSACFDQVMLLKYGGRRSIVLWNDGLPGSAYVTESKYGVVTLQIPTAQHRQPQLRKFSFNHPANRSIVVLSSGEKGTAI